MAHSDLNIVTTNSRNSKAVSTQEKQYLRHRCLHIFLKHKKTSMFLSLSSTKLKSLLYACMHKTNFLQARCCSDRGLLRNTVLPMQENKDANW